MQIEKKNTGHFSKNFQRQIYHGLHLTKTKNKIQ